MTERQEMVHEWEWNVTFDDFCEHLKQGELTHESWFRNQQKRAVQGELPENRNEKLTAALEKGWECANITGLRNTVRAGDIGIMKNPDNCISLGEAVADLSAAAETLEM